MPSHFTPCLRPRLMSPPSFHFALVQHLRLLPFVFVWCPGRPRSSCTVQYCTVASL